MKRSWNVLSVVLGALALVAFSPAAGADEVRGFFEGPNHGNNAGTGVIPMTGWAVATSGIQRVDILVDGRVVGRALLGQQRPDVAAEHPGFPDNPAAGFGFFLNSTDFLNGLHTITAEAVSMDGTRLPLAQPAETREVFFTNNTHTLRPFGKINQPHRNAILRGSCEPGTPPRYTVISGWALDLGVEIGDSGIGYVELLVDGAIIFNTRTSCTFSNAVGGLVNCYGFFRPDIERSRPFAIDAPNSGFRFVLDIGDLIEFLGYVQGHHTLTIRAGDISNNVENIDEIPVNFQCVENFNNENSFGRITSPAAGRQYSGSMEVRGWALDWEGIDEVQIRLDGEPVGTAAYGVDSSPFVSANHPGYPNSALPVFSLFVDTTLLNDGFHQVQAIAVDLAGKTTHIGEVTFNVNNDPGGSHPVDD